jgi:hypothetical protein
MESTEATIETSIGTLGIQASERHRINITSAEGVCPRVLFNVVRDGDTWKAEYSRAYVFDPGEGPTPPTPEGLPEELVALAAQWAGANPGAFEIAGREEFTQIIRSTTDFTFAEAIYELQRAQADLKSIVEEPEFVRYASPQLIRRVKAEAQKVRTMRAQIAGAAKAIKTLAAKCSMEVA